jgi:hypothetical protein
MRFAGSALRPPNARPMIKRTQRPYPLEVGRTRLRIPSRRIKCLVSPSVGRLVGSRLGGRVSLPRAPRSGLVTLARKRCMWTNFRDNPFHPYPIRWRPRIPLACQISFVLVPSSSSCHLHLTSRPTPPPIQPKGRHVRNQQAV